MNRGAERWRDVVTPLSRGRKPRRGDGSAAMQRRAVLAERARIASELHEGPIQHLATIALQAEVLVGLLERGAAAASDLAKQIGSTARVGADALRAAVADLTPPEAAPSSAARALVDEDVLTLVASFVREGLANHHKHAETARGEITIDFDTSTLMVTVRTRGTWHTHPESTPAGHGLAVMRARARLAGGSLHIETGDEDQAVRLVLPLDPSSESAC